jgi:hypothetical protein
VEPVANNEKTICKFHNKLIELKTALLLNLKQSGWLGVDFLRLYQSSVAPIAEITSLNRDNFSMIDSSPYLRNSL